MSDLVDFNSTPPVKNTACRQNTGIIERKVPIIKINQKKRIVYGIVYAPQEADAHNHFMSRDEIENMAHRWMMSSRKMDEQHDLISGSGAPVESFIVREGDRHFTDETGKARVGAWVLGTRVLDEKIWQKIVQKKIKAYSIYGVAKLGNEQEMNSRWVNDEGNRQNPYE